MSEINEGVFSIYANSAAKKYQILTLVKTIPTDDLSKDKLLEVLKQAKIETEIEVRTDEDNVLLQYRIVQKIEKCESCGKRSTSWSKSCGALVCGDCGKHKGLARCFCGWNLQAGEKLPDDIGNSKYLGEGEWEVNY